MSADLMLVCKERGENFEGDIDKCVFVDETSMGDPWHDFGKLFQDYAWSTIDDKLIEKVEKLYEQLEHHEGCNIETVKNWLIEHKGVGLDFECW